MMKKFDFVSILKAFGIDPDLSNIKEFHRGHINDSFILEVEQKSYFFLQRINHHVFKDPEALMENLVKVYIALNKHYGGSANNPFPGIHQGENNKQFYCDHDGNYWRVMDYVPDSRSFNIAENVEIARKGAAAFGLFQLAIMEEDPEGYIPTIPNFHHLGMRLEQLKDALEKDALKRSRIAQREIDFALERMKYGEQLAELLRKKIIPVRVTHNDTKLNNVLFENNSIKSICVVDLDTVMPGTVLYDYGDMVRTFTSPLEEDEPDPAKVVFREEIFEALTEGYLSELGGSLTKEEKEHLLFGAKIMLLMIGARFLTDFLEGDHYFKTTRENHNLDRCRNQFILLRQLEEKENELQEIISKYS
ncbi:MAG: aminoglycoside phosphotransferase family protein [Bacteroidetes bacterium]|nr:aminoglycoside phosphotransferase family protein [Bacteroidota bacterium]